MLLDLLEGHPKAVMEHGIGILSYDTLEAHEQAEQAMGDMTP